MRRAPRAAIARTTSIAPASFALLGPARSRRVATISRIKTRRTSIAGAIPAATVARLAKRASRLPTVPALSARAASAAPHRLAPTNRRIKTRRTSIAVAIPVATLARPARRAWQRRIAMAELVWAVCVARRAATTGSRIRPSQTSTVAALAARARLGKAVTVPMTAIWRYVRGASAARSRARTVS
jgi:hypothetical protein